MKSNPFKSQAQRRLFHAKARRGEISPKVVREWERETGKRKLPERANPVFLSPTAVREHAKHTGRTGKHGNVAPDFDVSRIKNVRHVRLSVPLAFLDAIEPHDSARVEAYARRETAFPSIMGSYNARSFRRGHPTIYVSNGNHRVAAAVLRGDTHISVIMPEEDWKRWERGTGKRKLPERVNPATSDFMDHYRSRTWQNPMNPAQRGWSVRLASGEEAPFVLTELVERKGGGWVPHIWVKSISSPQQKSTGVASYILKQITNMADQHDTVLMLTAEPFRTGGVGRALSKAKLIGWYGRNGFISEDKDFPERMTRYPEGQKASLPLRPNPSQGPSKKALKKYKDTHWGIEASATMRKDDPDLPKELVEMGKLLEIGVVPETQEKPYALEFPAYEDTSLAFSQGKDERLYPILPKRAEQAVKKAHWKPNEPTVRLGEVNKLTGGRMDQFKCPAIQVQVLGRANYVIYQTQKLDDMKEDGQASHYIHELGEESGILPYICVAQDGTLWFAGGNYRVLNGGIAD